MPQRNVYVKVGKKIKRNGVRLHKLNYTFPKNQKIGLLAGAFLFGQWYEFRRSCGMTRYSCKPPQTIATHYSIVLFKKPYSCLLASTYRRYLTFTYVNWSYWTCPLALRGLQARKAPVHLPALWFADPRGQSRRLLLNHLPVSGNVISLLKPFCLDWRSKP